MSLTINLLFKHGYKGSDLSIEVADLTHLCKKPHIEALKVRYKMFEEVEKMRNSSALLSLPAH